MAIRCLNAKRGLGYDAIHGDCVDVVRQLPDNSVGFSVYSPPFSNIFVYSDSAADMGNSADDAEFQKHYGYLLDEMTRVTKPGRLSAVHCSDLPLSKWKDGVIGIKSFSEDIIRAHLDRGWIMHSRVTIWRDPVIEMTRTKALGLLYKQLLKDSTRSRQGMADYLIVFRAPGENAEPVGHDKDKFPVDTWQKWASPVWMDIRQTDTLNVKMAKDGADERHLCLASGSLVLTRELGYIPIETIEIGQHVLTHLGRWMPVMAKRNNGTKNIVRTCAQGVADLRTTPDHQLWTRRAYGANPTWIEAKDTLGSYLNSKLPPIEESPLTNSQWWIVGRWLGDGHHGGHKRSGLRGDKGRFFISCAHDKVPLLVKNLGIHAGHVGCSENTTAPQIALINLTPQMIDVLVKCGKVASKKRLPGEAVALCQEKAQALLDGYLSADGCYVACHDHVTASSVSRALLLGMSLVAQRARSSVASVYAGRQARDDLIAGWIDDDGAWRKVRKIKPAGITDVWDISVAEDMSYTAEGCIVHNCPLQLDLIERAITMWSNPGDVVLSPFMGVGSEGFVALRLKRKFVGVELKESYWRYACKHLDSSESTSNTFFDLLNLADAS